MWKIANNTINGKTVLAPMAGITTNAYREFMRSFAIALSYTEMISDSGLIFNNAVTYTYLPKKDEKRPLSIQLFGGEASRLIAALKKIEAHTDNYDFIDLNLGCPVPKVTRNNGGSAWLKYPDDLVAMVSEVVQASKKPVTVKIRLGWDEETINFKDLMPRLEKAGVALIAVHLRTTAQFYGGKARYDLAHDLQSLISVPLVISGDIFTLDDAINALKVTGAQAVMLARGQLGNPYLATQIETYFKTGERLPNPTIAEQVNYLLVLAKMLIEEKGEHMAMLLMRGLGPHFLKGYPDTKRFRTQMTTINTYAELQEITNELLLK